MPRSTRTCALLAKTPDVVIKHGSARLYQRLLATARDLVDLSIVDAEGRFIH